MWVLVVLHHLILNKSKTTKPWRLPSWILEFMYSFSFPDILGVKLQLLSFQAIVWAVFPSLCGVLMDAPEGSFALIGEGQVKWSSDRIRKERTGTARQTAPGERETHVFHVISSIYLIDWTDRVPSEGKWRGSPNDTRETCSRRRDGLCCFFSCVWCRKVSRIYPR